MSWRRDEFLASLTSASSNTVAAYRADLDAFVAWVGRAGMSEPAGVDRLLLRRYLAYLQTRGYAPRSVARKASALRRYFAWLRHVGAVPVDPARALRSPGGDSRLPRVLSASELHLLLDEPPARLDDDPAELRLRDDAVLEVLYGCGLRVGELCGLDVPDVGLATRTLTVWGKGGKQRQVPLGQPAAEALDGWLRSGRPVAVSAAGPDLRSGDEAAVFLNQRHHRLTPRDVRRIVDRRAPRQPTRTPCVTATPPTSWTVARISGRCRSCSATRTSRRRRSTRTSARNGSSRSTGARTPAPEDPRPFRRLQPHVAAPAARSPRPAGGAVVRSSLLRLGLAAAAVATLAGPLPPAMAVPTCLVPPVAARIVTPYRPPACTWCPGNRGVDYATTAGTVVRAAAAGTVTFAGPVAGAVWVTVAHAGGVLTSYGPLRAVMVRRGAVLTTSSVLGAAAGSLHFGVRVGGHYVDPEPLLAAPVHLVPRLVPLTGHLPRPPALRCPSGSPIGQG